jgi:multisubunit Na+/H+ antiporter MnhC subunit
LLYSYRDDPTNILAQSIPVAVADEKTVAVVISNSLISSEGSYYVYLVHRGVLSTNAVPILGEGDGEESKASYVGLIVGIVFAIVAVVAVVVVVVVFLVWRNNEIKRRTSESEVERMMSGGVVYVMIICYCCDCLIGLRIKG